MHKNTEVKTFCVVFSFINGLRSISFTHVLLLSWDGSMHFFNNALGTI